MVFNRKLNRYNYYLTHRDLELSRSHEYNNKNKEKRRIYAKKHYWDHREDKLVKMRIYREHNKYRMRYIKKKRYDEVRRIVISHYSNNMNKCEICGESDFRFLSIDHINGGGTKQRKIMKFSSNRLYMWLIKEGFPKGYRVLCFNCNVGYVKYKCRPKEERSMFNREYRIIAIDHYSNYTLKCACCGYNKYETLTFDHINNDGAEHRRNIRIRSIGTWLVRNNFPDGFQVLCYNCNMGRFFNSGICPHSDQK